MAGCRFSLSLLFLGIGVTIGAFFYFTHVPDALVPEEFRQDHYWGPKAWKLGDKVPNDDATIEPFIIEVDEKVLVDLKRRLSNTRIQESIPDANFEYGMHSNVLKKVVNHWLNNYDWRKEEKKLNQYPHFKTQIEGLDIHFMHVKPKSTAGKKVVPLMLVHGWPGSFVEFMGIIPHLTEGKDVVFELIIPSIPGYGFSQAAQKRGLNLHHVARIFVKLMKRLGHEKFLYQGGDWGSGIGAKMAAVFPENMIGFHTNFPMVVMGVQDWLRLVAADFGLAKWVFDDPESEMLRMNPVSRIFKEILRESGYMHLQATKPDTVGAGLNDSPTGLAAYILEKFSSWTNMANIDKPDGGLTEKFNLDDLLTNVMIYWINGNVASSQRLYKESMTVLENFPIRVPYGVCVGRHELPFSTPKTILKKRIPTLIHYKDAESGGHFLAMEEPKLLADDIRDFYHKLNHTS